MAMCQLHAVYQLA